MAKTKKNIQSVSKKGFFDVDANLFIKLVLVIVISSLFLIAILSIINKVWQKDSSFVPVNANMADYLIEKRIPDVSEPLPVEEDDGPIMCTMEYMPVCAWKSDGICVGAEDCPHQTYGNKCVAGADKATIISEGECE
jgi:uncharacterized membrane protein